MDSTSSSSHGPARQGSTSRRIHPKRQTYTDEEWRVHRIDITRLYKMNTATEIRCILEDDHDFFVDEHMLKRRFRKWGLRKYGSKAKNKVTSDRSPGLESLRIGQTPTNSPDGPLDAEEADQGRGHSDHNLTQQMMSALVSHNATLDPPSEMCFRSSENFSQPGADQLDLIYGDFRPRNDLDLPLNNDTSDIIVSQAQLNSAREQEADSEENLDSFSSWVESLPWTNDAEFSWASS